MLAGCYRAGDFVEPDAPADVAPPPDVDLTLCPVAYSSVSGGFYRVANVNTLSWFEAKAQCEADQMNAGGGAQTHLVVIGSGVTHSVRELVEVAFRHAGLDWRDWVKVDPAFIRPAEVDVLQADPARAARELGWTPAVSFEALVAMMVEADLERLGGR